MFCYGIVDELQVSSTEAIYDEISFLLLHVGMIIFVHLKSLFPGVLSHLKYLLSKWSPNQRVSLPKSVFHKFVMSKHFYSSSVCYNLLQSDAFKQRPVPAVRSTIRTPLFLICCHFFKLWCLLLTFCRIRVFGITMFFVCLFVWVRCDVDTLYLLIMYICASC